MIRFSIVTLFPDIIASYCSTSIIGRAQKENAISISIYNLRDWTTDKHHTVDDRVFGGGPGMLLKIEPLYKAITELKTKAEKEGYTPLVIATAASGKLFSQIKATSWAQASSNTDYIIICGHYEGFDARIKSFVDEFITVGPYVLTGGELPALIMIDAVTRLLPNVLGNAESPQDETLFTIENGQIKVDGEHPQYTMPADFTYIDTNDQTVTATVPEILRSGHHANIKKENTSQRIKKDLIVE